MKHLLTPFNGMHSGFNEDGTPASYTAQISTLKRIIDFTPQDNSARTPVKFGSYQLLYNQAPTENPIQLVFSLSPLKAFTVTMLVTTNVTNSKFTFTIDGIDHLKTADINGANVLNVSFKGNPTGVYRLTINPDYKMDATTFLLTEIRIEEN